MKRAALLLVLYTNATDPGSAIFCDLESFVYGPPLVGVAKHCQPDRVFASEFEDPVQIVW